MFPLGFGILFLGIWLVESGYKNRAPLATLAAIFADPKNARKTVSASSGTFTPAGGGDGTSLPSPPPAGSGATVTGAAGVAIAFARAQIGKPYVWGATGPSSYDCSGLVQAAYRAAGVSLPRTTYQQVLVGSPVNRADLVPGDLVFPDPGHVGIYTGNGMWIEAPHSGAVVREVQEYGFWRARRVTRNYGVGANIPDTTSRHGIA